MSEMRHALNVPVRRFLRVYQSLLGMAINPSEGPAFANSGLWPMPPVPTRVTPLRPLPSVPLVRQSAIHSLTALDLLEAQNLARDLKKYPKEMALSDSPGEAVAAGIDSTVQHADLRDVQLHHYHGTVGTGKSYAMVGDINRLVRSGVRPSDILVCSWTEPLRAQLLSDMLPLCPGLTTDNFKSGYRPFVAAAQYVFLDDATLFPSGYIPMLLFNFKSILAVTLSYDCAQLSTVFPEANCLSRSARTTSQWLAPMVPGYATLIRRCSEDWCELMGFPADLATTRGEVVIVTQPPRNVPLVVISKRFAETQTNAGVKCYAISDVQGLTIRGDNVFDCGGLTSTTPDAATWTAMTRQTGTLWLRMGPTLPMASTLQEVGFGTSGILTALFALAAHRQSPVLNAALDRDQVVARAVRAHLATSLGPAAVAALGLDPPAPVVAGFAREVPGAHEAIADWQRSVNKAFTAPRTFLRSGQAAPARVLRGPPTGPRSEAARHALRFHLPLCQDTQVSAPPNSYVPPPLPLINPTLDPLDLHARKEHDPDAELIGNTIEPTNVFDPLGPDNAQHHRADDQALHDYSMDRRCPPRRDDPTLRGYDFTRLRQLKAGFLKSIPLEEQPLNETLLEESIVRCAESWIQGKTMSAINKALDSSPVDADPLYLAVFVKGQWIKKLEAAGAPAKKAQIITRVALTKVFQDAVWAHYVEHSLKAAAPATTLLFSGLDPTQLKEWYSTNWLPGIGVTSCDYTGWDTGMDRVFLAFDLWLFGRLGLPQEMRDAISATAPLLAHTEARSPSCSPPAIATPGS